MEQMVFSKFLGYDLKNESERKQLLDLLIKRLDAGQLPKDAFQISPELLEHIYAVAYGLFNGGNYQKAADFFNYLIGLDPYCRKYIMGWAAAQHSLGDHTKALVGYTIAQLLDPLDLLPTFFSADCLQELGYHDNAAFALELFLQETKSKEGYTSFRNKAALMLQSMQKASA